MRVQLCWVAPDSSRNTDMSRMGSRFLGTETLDSIRRKTTFLQQLL